MCRFCRCAELGELGGVSREASDERDHPEGRRDHSDYSGLEVGNHMKSLYSKPFEAEVARTFLTKFFTVEMGSIFCGECFTFPVKGVAGCVHCGVKGCNSFCQGWLGKSFARHDASQGVSYPIILCLIYCMSTCVMNYNARYP